MNEVEERIFSGDFRVVVCASRVVKMKDHLLFCSILQIEDRVGVDRVV